MLELDKYANKPAFTRYTSQSRIIGLKGDDDNDPLPDESHLSEEDKQILPATPKVTQPKEQDGGDLHQRVKSISYVLTQTKTILQKLPKQ